MKYLAHTVYENPKPIKHRCPFQRRNFLLTEWLTIFPWLDAMSLGGIFVTVDCVEAEATFVEKAGESAGGAF